MTLVHAVSRQGGGSGGCSDDGERRQDEEERDAPALGRREVDEVRRVCYCDWCGAVCEGRYYVAAAEREYAVCPICWGRSPTYLEMREDGITHRQALAWLDSLPAAAIGETLLRPR